MGFPQDLIALFAETAIIIVAFSSTTFILFKYFSCLESLSKRLKPKEPSTETPDSDPSTPPPTDERVENSCSESLGKGIKQNETSTAAANDNNVSTPPLTDKKEEKSKTLTHPADAVISGGKITCGCETKKTVTDQEESKTESTSEGSKTESTSEGSKTESTSEGSTNFKIPTIKITSEDETKERVVEGQCSTTGDDELKRKWMNAISESNEDCQPPLKREYKPCQCPGDCDHAYKAHDVPTSWYTYKKDIPNNFNFPLNCSSCGGLNTESEK